MTKKTFILGLGAQKSGTSWLHRYLETNASFNAGVAKEYHIWDIVDIPLFAPYRTKFQLRASEKIRLRRRLQKNPEKYFEYFDSLLTNGHMITADITPSYCGLSAQALTRIRDGMAKRGIETKVVFLMRDPVDRCKSAVRMKLGRQKNKAGEMPFCDALQEYYASDAGEIRGRYDQTMDTVKSVFDPKDRYFGVFETMFEPENIKQMSDFLGVEHRPELGQKKVHPTGGARVECPGVEADIRSHFAQVYEYCYDALPETRTVWTAPAAQQGA